MKKHKSYGFTVVELIVVIVVIAVLVSITAIAYRTTQADSRDKKRQADVLMLKSALEEYYANNGGYPRPGTCTYGPGGTNECWDGEVWKMLVAEGYMDRIPMPDVTSSHTVGSDGKFYYGYYGQVIGKYGIYVPLESGHCKTGGKIEPTWWGDSVKECDY